MIFVSGVSKSFNSMQRKAVDEATFEAKPGRITGLLGANGSGKTTLMRLMSGILQPDSGFINICDIDVSTKTQQARKHIGVLLGGDVSLYGRLTAYENIMYFAQLQGVPYKTANKRILEIAELLGMTEYLNRRVSSFSRGMKQKVAFGKTIIHDPDVILLDEPSTGLDIYSVRDVEEFILKCKARGKAIILSTHNAHEIGTLCDDVVIIKEGCIIANDSMSNVMKRAGADNVMDMFFNLEEGN